MSDPTGCDEWALKQAADAAMDGIAILDHEEAYRYVNRAHADLYGFDDPEALVGKDWRTLYGESEVERFESEVMPVLREAGEWRGEATGRRTDGREFTQELSLSLTDGGIVCVVRDVTERRERRKRLERYETAMQNIHDGVYTLDAEGRITWINKTAIEAFDSGYEREDLVGSFVTKILDDEDVEKCLSLIQELLREDPHGSRWCEIAIQTAYGDEIHCELNLSLRPFEDGEFRGTVGVVRDISGRKRREQQLSVLNRVLRHNLRNELNVIEGNAERLATELDDEHARQARLISKASEQIIDIAETARRIEAVLDRDDATTSVDVAAVVEERCADLRDAHPDATIAVETPSERRAIADESLGEAVERLVETAIGNPGAEPVATVTVREADDRMEIRVADGGTGLPRSEIEVLFEDRETPLRHGKGLDMWFVKWLVNSYGGELDFERETPEGSVVVVRLRPASVAG
ncbi:hypothetical protein BRC67_01910 [Halobacteriales archaeon QH_3_68_24]|nr:MAG: hypothetical protein BRC67_01910 [Halobacteriales archaeon QH_3_68_24]